MAVIVHENFQGEIPRINPHLLPENAAQRCLNAKLWGRDLRPFNQPLDVAPLFYGATTVTIHRYAVNGVEYWLNWPFDVDMVRGPWAQDTRARRYYTGDGVPKKTDSTLAPGDPGTMLPAGSLFMGVQAPTVEPGLAIQAAGSGESQLTSYMVTHITDTGEESAPSIPAEIVRNEIATIRITRFPQLVAASASDVNDTIDFAAAHGLPTISQVRITADAPAGTSTGVTYIATASAADKIKLSLTIADALANVFVDITASDTPTVQQWGLDPRYGVTGWRVYRTQVGTDGVAAFRFVAEVASMETQFVDDDVLAKDLGEALRTLGWAEPPDDLMGLISTPFGALAAYRPSTREVCFSEPFAPYAWPFAYRYPLEYDPVGLAAVAAGILVGTVGRPYLLQGQHPGHLSAQMLASEWGCVSKRSAKESPLGALYAARQGLFLGGPGIEALITGSGDPSIPGGVASEREWRRYRPETFISAVFDGRYYFIYTPAGTITNQIGIFNPADPQERLTFLDLDAKALYSDVETAGLYAVLAGRVVLLDGDNGNPMRLTWKSRHDRMARPLNLSVLKVVSDVFTGHGVTNFFDSHGAARAFAAAHNAALDFPGYVAGACGASAFGLLAFGYDEWIDPLPDLGDGVVVRVYGDHELRAERTVKTRDPVRLPGGYQAEHYEIEVESAVQVEQVVGATSVAELNQVP